ncbi:MAG: AbrB family transcriptional regulator [Burkholderiales bacterium]|jgi:membrane AbrB-like protein|nr:AbrB family transcriptional regulator [Burkholderiales bacterium]
MNLAQKPVLIQWGALLLLTTLLVSGLSLIALPGAFLLGAMIAGVIVALNGASISMPNCFYQGAQAMIGTLIATTLTPWVFHSFVEDWALFVGVVLASLVASTALGYALKIFHVMPGVTGIWGITPGAASAMVIMAEAYGADMRLVAVMQYLRVVMVAATAAVCAHFFAEPVVHEVAASFDFTKTLASSAPTLAIMVGGAVLAAILRVPSGMLFFPLAIGAVLSVSEVVTLHIPRTLQIVAFVALGWKIGLRFTREVLLYSLSALPKILLSIVVLMVFCAGLALIVAHVLHVDYLTAFLATSPGGADAMVSIAAATQINIGFVMSVQVARLIIVILLGPPIARRLSR